MAKPMLHKELYLVTRFQSQSRVFAENLERTHTQPGRRDVSVPCRSKGPSVADTDYLLTPFDLFVDFCLF